LAILHASGVPNPGAGRIALELGSGVDDVVIKVWTPALVLVGAQHSGPLSRGWQSVALDPALLQRAPRGLIYVSLEARQGARHAPAKAPLRLYLLN
jgi:hypothetical protein